MITSHGLRTAATIVNPESITYLNSYTSGPITATSFTFSNINFGNVYSGRRIVLIVGNNVTGTPSAQLTSITIGGVSATQLISAETGVTNTIQCAIYVATVPNNTSGDIVINTNAGGTAGSRIIHVYTLNSTRTTVVTGSDITSSFTFIRTFTKDDIYIGGGRCVSTTTETWTNATERAAIAEAASQRISSATYAPASAGSRTITFTPANTSGAIMVSAVFI